MNYNIDILYYMSHYYINDECDASLYAIIICGTDSWKCCICHITEMVIEYDNIKFIWERYQLQCGHESHIRCYNKWCKQIDTLGCPICKIYST